MNKKIPAYLSMAIRGREGDRASAETMIDNIERAKIVGKRLRKGLPILELYVPHEWEYLTQALVANVCGIEDILKLDAAIIKLCRVLILGTKTRDSGGCAFEVKVALDHGVYVVSVNPEEDVCEPVLKLLRKRKLVVPRKEIKNENTVV